MSATTVELPEIAHAASEDEFVLFNGTPHRVIRQLNARPAGKRQTNRWRVLALEDNLVAHVPSRTWAPSRRMIAYLWETIQRIKHPGFAKIYGPITDADGVCGFVREFLPVHDESWRNIAPNLRLSTILRQGARLAFALEHLHTLDCGLGDLSPANIGFRIESGGLRPALFDFDTLTYFGDRPFGMRELEYIGTPEYAAAEQIVGSRAMPASDEAMLAWCLMNLICRTPGFHVPNEEIGDTLLRANEGIFPYWYVLRSYAPTPVCTMLTRASSPRIAERYGSCRSFGLALITGARYVRARGFDRVVRQAPWTDDELIEVAIPLRKAKPVKK